jgi:AcrR family transcriptional regulator
MARPPTRKERQQQTRSGLLAAAAKVFGRRGLQQGSIDEVASEAGYTKGAFYANFSSKEELFLAMLDEHFGRRVDEVERALGSSEDLESQAREAGRDFLRAVDADEEWKRLFFEFAAYASRNEAFRDELVTRYRALRSRLAELIARSGEAAGVEPPISPDRFALMTFAMANGVALEALLEPEAVDEDLLGQMFEIFVAGLLAVGARTRS